MTLLKFVAFVTVFSGIVIISPITAGLEEFCQIKRTRKMPEICPDVLSYKPWVFDVDCSKYDVTLAPANSWNPRAMVHFPSVATSGLGRMIEHSSGFYFGNALPIHEINGNFEGELKSGKCRLNQTKNIGNTIMQKADPIFYEMFSKGLMRNTDFPLRDMNWKDLAVRTFSYRGILFIQNPWDSLTEFRPILRKQHRYCNFCRKRSSGLAEEFDFEENEFQKYFTRAAAVWVKSVKTWVKESPHGSDLIIVKYENFMANPKPDLIRILNYLDVPFDEDRMNCVLKHSRREYDPLKIEMRKSVSKILSNNDKANAILSEGIKEINQLFVDRGIKEKLTYTSATY